MHRVSRDVRVLESPARFVVTLTDTGAASRQPVAADQKLKVYEMLGPPLQPSRRHHVTV